MAVMRKMRAPFTELASVSSILGGVLKFLIPSSNSQTIAKGLLFSMIKKWFVERGKRSFNTSVSCIFGKEENLNTLCVCFIYLKRKESL